MKKLIGALVAASLALTATPALADHHDRGNHYGELRHRDNHRFNSPRIIFDSPYYYNSYPSYSYTDSYWRYNNYYRCHRKTGGIGVLVDPYTGHLVLELGSRRVVCR